MKHKPKQHVEGRYPQGHIADTGMNPQQKTAAESEKGPLLIVAGAGTGKTKTLTSRLAHFIKEGMDPRKICAITFTNKAAKEMENRALKLLSPKALKPTLPASGLRGFGTSGPFIGTFHALGAKILRKEARLLGRGKNFTIFDDHDSFDLIKKIAKKLVPKKPGTLAEKSGKQPARDTKTPSFFTQKISEIKNKKLFLTDLGKSARPQDALAAQAFGLYEKNLEENNAFDFDDLIEKPVQLFRKHPDILKKYQGEFDAILVDEYQDASPMQYELVRLLAGSHKNVSAVGDDEQLIYGWRYADLEIFLGFEKDWPGARVEFLEENYRSTGNIIAAASGVSKHNLERRPKNLWTKNPAGTPIVIAETADEEEEAEWIAKKALGLSTAVLYRTNAQSRAIEQALIRHGIPYQIFGGLKFYERKEVKDMVAVLRYFVNRNDSVSRERLEKNFSLVKISEIENIYAAAENGKISPARFIETVLGGLDYLDYLEKNFTNYSERQENIAELIRFAARFELIGDLLQEIALVQSTDAPSSSKSRAVKNNPAAAGHTPTTNVHLSTIHLAKGLEFDRVFIAGCCEGILPHERSLEDDKRLEEERRLMYVAMTRAKKELFISFYDLPSRFISEIPRELVEFENPSPPDQDFADDLEEIFID